MVTCPLIGASALRTRPARLSVPEIVAVLELDGRGGPVSNAVGPFAELCWNQPEADRPTTGMTNSTSTPRATILAQPRLLMENTILPAHNVERDSPRGLASFSAGCRQRGSIPHALAGPGF